MSVTPLPKPPTSADPADFGPRGDAFWAGACGPMVGEINQLNLDGVDAVTVTAAALDAIAIFQAQINNILGAQIWVSGTDYAADFAVFSPIDFQTYLRISAGAGTTDPSADAGNWRLISFGTGGNALVAPSFVGGLTVAGGLDVDAITADGLTAAAAVHEHYAAVAGTDIDCSVANWFGKTISGATTLTVSSVPPGLYAMVLELTGASDNVTLWDGILWANGLPPTFSSGRDVAVFVTANQGARWIGAAIARNAS